MVQKITILQIVATFLFLMKLRDFLVAKSYGGQGGGQGFLVCLQSDIYGIFGKFFEF